ncbi:MAG: Nif3-like dinuclear metal center hexameric protein [Actinobacteria bacterium]|nr:Nif3-like dinuclear metal center hexameric protein [Actinomycetota bacterium]
MNLSNLLSTFEKLWPSHTAEDWDRPGLMIGNPDQQVQKVLLSVDVTADVLEQAVSEGAQLLLTHHPLLLRPVHELGELTLKGNLVSKAIRSNLAIFSAHTNADIAVDGVSQSIAKLFGLTNTSALDTTSGHGIAGDVDETTLIEFARKIAKLLPSTAQGIKVAGSSDRKISRVGLVGGAGDSFLPIAAQSGLDLFITSDLRHHPAQDFSEQAKLVNGPALIDISHWAAEWVWLDSAAKQLSRLHPEVDFVVSDLRTDPWDFAVMQ